MRAGLHFVLAACAAPLLLTLAGGARPGHTGRCAEGCCEGQPAAEAGAGGVVRGRVGAGAGWDVRKPDLTRAVIYLASDPGLERTGQPEPAVVAQRDKAFVPNFTVVERGTVVEFPNYDNYDHNVFSRSKAAPAFDLDRYPKGKSKSRTFEKVGVVQVFCNIHPQMRAMVYVTPNRFFVRADAQGNFELKGVPAGTYRLVAWHERCGEKEQEIAVGAGGVTEVSFLLDESRKSVMENAPPRREEGYGVERGLGIKREKLDLPVVTESHAAPEEPK